LLPPQQQCPPWLFLFQLGQLFLRGLHIRLLHFQGFFHGLQVSFQLLNAGIGLGNFGFRLFLFFLSSGNQVFVINTGSFYFILASLGSRNSANLLQNILCVQYITAVFKLQ
jgi:hypothetical protein